MKYVVTPVEPTEEMHTAGMRPFNDRLAGVADVWHAMLTAAPPYEPSDDEIYVVALQMWGPTYWSNHRHEARAALIAADKARREGE